MKTVKILIALAILSTSFYACKKEEMNIKSGEVEYINENKSNLSVYTANESTDGIVKIVFDKVGNMFIDGNPNLLKLITMYNASNTAISAAQAVFEVTDKSTLCITFDRNGFAVASDIPTVPVGSSLDVFLADFCKVKPVQNMSLEITKTEVERNYDEFWVAMPIGSMESFESNIKNVQNNMEAGYTLHIEISPDQNIVVELIDQNGNPKPIQQTNKNCEKIFSGSFASFLSFGCIVSFLDGWV
jgi:hypothetical protein